ncbi:MAG: hypothetical protein OXF05_09495 [Hyphomicrobiales bacterium]|nr:hypothetical protein [Hyphomicrobiales bacterium]
MLRGFSVIALLALCAGEANAAGSENASGSASVERVNLGAPGSVFCPPVSVLPLTGRITIFEENAESIIYRASIDSAIISCATEGEGLPKSADVSFSGIAESGRAEIITGELPVFLTVLYQQRVVYQKQVEDLAVVFTPEMNKIAYKGKFEDVAIPDVATSAREDLRFLVGFQLDEQQLQHNRRTAIP